MIYLRLSVLSALVIGLLTASSCQRYAAPKELVNTNGYFSITQFANDAVNTYMGTPFSLYKVTYVGDKMDSTVVNFMNMDWASIFITFNATDISYNKFKGKYKEDLIEDNTTGTRSFMYSALEPDLVTRIMQVSFDPSNNRITSIYIETAKHDFWGDKKQKLLYVPLRVIHIQESENHLIGRSRNTRVDYRFMQEEEIEQI